MDRDGRSSRRDPARFAAIAETAEAGTGTGMPARSDPARFAALLREGPEKADGTLELTRRGLRLAKGAAAQCCPRRRTRRWN